MYLRMKKNYTSLTLLASILTVIFLSSCEKDITVDLPQAAPQYIVEGYVETGKLPYVLLSKTTPYFAAFDSTSLYNYVVKGATVIISDGITTDTLIELSQDIGYFYFTLDSNLKGVVGRTYSLKVITPDSTILTAETSILQPLQLDSTWFKIQEGKDSLGYVWARMSDPDTLGNSYRWFAKRHTKDKQFIAPIGSVFDDKFINGKTFDFAYNRGEVPNSRAEDDLNEEKGFFKDGDTIDVKFCTITQASFKFWRMAESQSSSNGSPFSSPAVLPSNINGGVGIFEGYSPTIYTVIAKK